MKTQIVTHIILRVLMLICLGCTKYDTPPTLHSGCGDACSLVYDSLAIQDDGSCEYPVTKQDQLMFGQWELVSEFHESYYHAYNQSWYYGDSLQYITFQPSGQLTIIDPNGDVREKTWDYLEESLVSFPRIGFTNAYSSGPIEYWITVLDCNNLSLQFTETLSPNPGFNYTVTYKLNFENTMVKQRQAR